MAASDRWPGRVCETGEKRFILVSADDDHADHDYYITFCSVRRAAGASIPGAARAVKPNDVRPALVVWAAGVVVQSHIVAQSSNSMYMHSVMIS